MTVKNIIKISPKENSNNSSFLRTKCENVSSFNEELAIQVNDIVDTLMAHKIAVGLAAPQIGISKRIFAVNLKLDDSETLVFINPEILNSSGKKDKKKESCMSVPHFRGIVERRDKLTVKFQTLIGEYKTIETSGFVSRVIMHEMDHIDGFLYIDRVNDIDVLEPVDFFKDVKYDVN